MTFTDSKHSVILLSVFVIVSPTKREFFHTRIGIIYVVFPNALFFWIRERGSSKVSQNQNNLVDIGMKYDEFEKEYDKIGELNKVLILQCLSLFNDSDYICNTISVYI